MAFGARRVFPNDLRPRVAIGVNIPLSGPIAFEPNYQTKDAIRNNLINFLLSNLSPGFDNPTFGAGLRNYIFSQVENKNLEFIREDVQDKVNQNFPNIDIEELEVFATENANTIKINLIYSIPNTGINDTLELNFS